MANILLSQGYELYYFKNEKSTLEIDFVITSKDVIIPVEIKATSSKAKSLNEVVKNNLKYPYVKYGIKISSNNIELKNNILNLPHYLAFKLRKIISDEKFIKNINLI